MSMQRKASSPKGLHDFVSGYTAERLLMDLRSSHFAIGEGSLRSAAIEITGLNGKLEEGGISRETHIRLIGDIMRALDHLQAEVLQALRE